MKTILSLSLSLSLSPSGEKYSDLFPIICLFRWCDATPPSRGGDSTLYPCGIEVWWQLAWSQCRALTRRQFGGKWETELYTGNLTPLPPGAPRGGPTWPTERCATPLRVVSSWCLPANQWCLSWCIIQYLLGIHTVIGSPLKFNTECIVIITRSLIDRRSAIIPCLSPVNPPSLYTQVATGGAGL